MFAHETRIRNLLMCMWKERSINLIFLWAEGTCQAGRWYVEKGSLLGDVVDDSLVLVLKKDGKVLNYEDEFS